MGARDGEPDRAVKVLLDRRPFAVPYQRFRREIETHRSIGARPDVVPMLDWNLPEAPSKGDRAWLSMPIATPIREAVNGASLETVVEAVASVARTLFALRDLHGIAHRDVKPGNLYRSEGHWAVGDLGLVDVPGAEALTEPDRIVGPANFVAYEMMVSAQNADPFVADVYSLAKTLWVLATAQTWPPPGHQPVGDPTRSIGAYREHRGSRDLDRLVDLSTRSASERPTMDAFADECEAWLAPRRTASRSDLDLQDIADRIRSRRAPEIASEERAREVQAAASETTSRLLDGADPLLEAARKALFKSDVNDVDDVTRSLVFPLKALGLPAPVMHWHAGVRSIGPGRLPMGFRLMVASTLLDNDEIYLAGACLVAREQVLGSAFSRRYGGWQGRPGSLTAANAVDDILSEMSQDLPVALAVFADQL